MKIGFVVDDTLDKPDGVQQYVLTLSTWLKKQGHEVHFLVGESKRTDIDNVHSLSKNVGVKFNRNRLSVPLPSSSAKLKALLEREKFDVLHVQMPHNPFMAAKIVRFAYTQSAIIGTFHIAPFSKLETIATRALGVWLKKNLTYFDEIISVSSAARDFAKRTFKIDTVVIPNAVDINAFHTKTVAYDKATITFLGRLVERKGCQHLLRAAAELEKKYPATDYQVRVCGDGELRPKLEALREKLGIKAVFDFKGQVSESEKKDYLSRSPIAVFPSTGGESFGIVLIEAMAAGAQVVLAGDNPGYRSVMGEIPEAIFDPKDSKNFAKKLHTFLTDDALVKIIHERQQMLVKAYDVQAVGPKIIDTYEQAIAKKRLLTHN